MFRFLAWLLNEPRYPLPLPDDYWRRLGMGKPQLPPAYE